MIPGEPYSELVHAEREALARGDYSYDDDVLGRACIAVLAVILLMLLVGRRW